MLKEISQNKSCVLFLPTEEMLYFWNQSQGNVPLAVGKDTVMSFKTEVAYSYKEKKNPTRTILTQVVSYKTMANFLRVIITT